MQSLEITVLLGRYSSRSSISIIMLRWNGSWFFTVKHPLEQNCRSITDFWQSQGKNIQIVSMNSPQQFHLQTTIAQLTAMTNRTHIYNINIYIYTYIHDYTCIYTSLYTIYTVHMFGVGQESRWIHLFCVWKAPQFDGLARLDFLPRGGGVVTRRPLELRLVHLNTQDGRDMEDFWGTPGGFKMIHTSKLGISLDFTCKTFNVKVNVKRKPQGRDIMARIQGRWNEPILANDFVHCALSMGKNHEFHSDWIMLDLWGIGWNSGHQWQPPGVSGGPGLGYLRECRWEIPKVAMELGRDSSINCWEKKGAFYSQYPHDFTRKKMFVGEMDSAISEAVTLKNTLTWSSSIDWDCFLGQSVYDLKAGYVVVNSAQVEIWETLFEEQVLWSVHPETVKTTN